MTPVELIIDFSLKKKSKFAPSRSIPQIGKQQGLLTVHDVTLKFQNLRSWYGEDNKVKLLGGARLLGDLPLVIFQVDLGHTLFEEDFCTCSKGKIRSLLPGFSTQMMKK